ncbi:exocyst complex component 8-like [Amphibalanus amphitrite]|uniref:exocyst complex component 8-like n=1 Tax=Amphibalanus amphitrite TaxID=1232801 RepID=UPI001C92886B|nr:exocyst complex component 8-like [Amphibalanus amphitrite]XP_043209471.1 exocyst complex component 8-like [Amphibalanus amphitrite]XP_043209472.1 exocyst complex component 8-like [Amphibalanus amphitrite]
MAESTNPLLVKQLTAADFNPARFVQDATEQCVGGLELRQHRQQIQLIADSTSNELKKNVYRNYQQFIHTAKEIQYLEGEMYQLSHQLTEQRSLLSSLCGPPPATALQSPPTEEPPPPTTPRPAAPDDLEERRRQLLQLMERVEGAAHIREVPSRYQLYESDLVELDQDTHTALQRVHGYLFNDALMMAVWLPDRRGRVRYKFEALFALDSVAVVNMRDVGSLKNAFKLLMFPETRVFQCATQKIKEEWLEIVDRTKRSKMDAERKQQSARQKRGGGAAVAPAPAESESAAESAPAEPPVGAAAIPEPLFIAEWLLEAPEDLDVFLAQREFEAALALLGRAREAAAPLPDSEARVQQLRSQLAGRRQHLTEALMAELRVEAGRSLQGGPRATRRALQLLIRLGHAGQACRLFLERRSALLRHELKQVKISMMTQLFVHRLSAVVFTSLADTTREFQRAFAAHPNCASALVVWARQELTNFMGTFNKQVFTAKVSLATLAECVTAIRSQADRLREAGLDVRQELDTALLRPVERAVTDARQKQLEAVRLRAAEDRWRPTNLQHAAGVARFQAEMRELGLPAAEQLPDESCRVPLTANTLQFCRSFLSLATELGRLSGGDLTPTVEDALAAVLLAQLQHAQQALQQERYRSERATVLTNGRFLLDELLRAAEQRYRDATGRPCPPMASLRTERSKFPDL